MFIALVEVLAIIIGSLVLSPMNAVEHNRINKFDDGFCRVVDTIEPVRKLGFHHVTTVVEFTKTQPEFTRLEAVDKKTFIHISDNETRSIMFNDGVVFINSRALQFKLPADTNNFLGDTMWYVLELGALAEQPFFPCHGGAEEDKVGAVYMNIWMDTWLWGFLLMGLIICIGCIICICLRVQKST